ncbi:MAG: hypothetical protein L0Y44_01310 [Phycisphaerales bacterium]|nr:hypothetical protein [Phycisphaerales bacterium]MCI0674941.1 hypothetical protein [Phycisphaerales bacterium]
MAESEPKRLCAGRAFMEAVQGDPEAMAALRRTQERLRAFAEHQQQLPNSAALVRRALEIIAEQLREAHAALDAAHAEAAELMADLIRGALDDMNSRLQQAGFEPSGRDLEAWEHLARMVECEPTAMTLGDIFNWAIAWADREKMRARIGASVQKPSKRQASGLTGEAQAVALLVQHPEWTDSQIAEAVGCARTSLYRWPKFTISRAALEQGRGGIATGRKDAQTGDLEAWDEDEDQDD